MGMRLGNMDKAVGLGLSTTLGQVGAGQLKVAHVQLCHISRATTVCLTISPAKEEIGGSIINRIRRNERKQEAQLLL